MNFFAKWIIIFLLSFLMIPCFKIGLFFWGQGKQVEVVREMHETFLHKENYLKNLGNQRKIVLIGGSSTRFGFDSKQMEEKLGIAVVNYGTFSSLGLYPLERVKQYLHEGDVVILPLEFYSYSYDEHVYDMNKWAYITSYDRSYFSHMSLLEKIRFINNWKMDDLLKYTNQWMNPPASKSTDDDSKYLTLRGDMSNNLMDNRRNDEELFRLIPSKVFSYGHVPSNDAQEVLSNFIRYCREKEITVYAAWPSYLWRSKKFVEEDEREVKNIEQFYRTMGIKILGDYRETLYEVDMCFNSNYHLNDIGRKRHTEHLLRLLEENK